MEYFLIVNLNKKSKLRKENPNMSRGWRLVVEIFDSKISRITIFNLGFSFIMYSEIKPNALSINYKQGWI